MNIKNLIVSTVALASLALAGTASAGLIDLNSTPNRTGSGQPGHQGGEFAALTTDNFVGAYASVATYDAGTRFATFCLERNENIGFSSTYNYVLNTAAVAGGIAGGNPDTLSFGTAYLYDLFATGSLTGYDYAGPNHKTHAGLLQEAFWVLENELVGPQGANMFLDLVTDPIGPFGSLANAQADYDPTQSQVRVLNLFSRTTGAHRQDLLVLVSRVPDAGMTVSLLGLGLMGIAALRRRM